ncbi:hypothetical protein SMD44_p10085 (plasmid) [Streptomyces alboflavus]|uniref:HNH endonuclease n=1 Tax=Streptomyces alboflavus TaxID=67267 RepID=A0A291W3K7_9ACTN|nr:hypothetical protein [Streptomyces alboflavus]ATM24584.1 hypothetical protein SMD44_p10085 [Streptomyces alboflavus]
MARRNYSPRTLKLLFGSASHCAYPCCQQPLIFKDRGLLTINVQIAHIRSESPDGPRHVDGYSDHSDVDGFENLLLLCGIHHGPVDRHESAYTIEELEDWKADQVAQTGQHLTDDATAAVLRAVTDAVDKLTRVDLAVELLGGLGIAGCRILPVPLHHMDRITATDTDGETYLGVHVTNRGLTEVTVTAAGIDLDVGAAEMPWYRFDGLLPLGHRTLPQGSRRLPGHDHATWYASTPVLGRVAQELTERNHPPLRIRPFAGIGSGGITVGEWTEATLAFRQLAARRGTDRSTASSD